MHIICFCYTKHVYKIEYLNFPSGGCFPVKTGSLVFIPQKVSSIGGKTWLFSESIIRS